MPRPGITLNVAISDEIFKLRNGLSEIFSPEHSEGTEDISAKERRALMGFFDKVFKGKETALPEGWQLHERTDLGLRFSCPADWRIGGIEGGIEICPPGCARVPDPLRGKEVPSPRVEWTIKDVPGADKTIVKETVKSRSGAYPGYRFVKHIASSVKNADQAAVYEFQYGAGDNLFSAISAFALSKNRIFSALAAGTRLDFDRYRGDLERIVSSFELI